MHPLKMFEILGHPHFKQLHGHKIHMNATNLPDRLNLYIFSLNLSYHSFASVHDIQQKRLLNKISVYTFTHPGGHHRVANATPFVACTRDGCATFLSSVTSSEVTWFTWSPLWRSTHLPNSEIFIARNNAFFIATAHVVKDAAHGPLARYAKLRVRMRRECRERFPRQRRQAIPTCITARASRTCRDACRDR